MPFLPVFLISTKALAIGSLERQPSTQGLVMVCKNTLETVKMLCRPALDAGLIPVHEFKELVKNAQLPDLENKEVEPELKLYTRKEAAEKLKISTRQLDRYHDAGYLKYIRIGTRALRIPADSLFAYMKNGIPETTEQNLNRGGVI